MPGADEAWEVAKGVLGDAGETGLDPQERAARGFEESNRARGEMGLPPLPYPDDQPPPGEGPAPADPRDWDATNTGAGLPHDGHPFADDAAGAAEATAVGAADAVAGGLEDRYEQRFEAGPADGLEVTPDEAPADLGVGGGDEAIEPTLPPADVLGGE